MWTLYFQFQFLTRLLILLWKCNCKFFGNWLCKSWAANNNKCHFVARCNFKFELGREETWQSVITFNLNLRVLYFGRLNFCLRLMFCIQGFFALSHIYIGEVNRGHCPDHIYLWSRRDITTDLSNWIGIAVGHRHLKICDCRAWRSLWGRWPKMRLFSRTCKWTLNWTNPRCRFWIKKKFEDLNIKIVFNLF